MKFTVRLITILQQKHLLVFFIALLFSYGVTGIFQVLNERPQSIHMFAQADRASVALNYYEEDMNFLNTSIHNTENETGRASLEFPLVNYLAALCYSLFGFNELYYRLIMLVLTTLGILCSYLLANKFLQNPLLSGLITLTWSVSPIIHYYAPNFLSSMASMGFAMIAWWCFFNLSAGKKWPYLFFISASLAGLTTISSGISLIAMFILVLLKQIFPGTSNKLLDKVPDGQYVLPLISTSMIMVAIWYLYAFNINKFFGSGHFLMNARPPGNWPEIVETLRMFYGLWIKAIYAPVTWFVIIVSAISSLLYFRKVNTNLAAVTTLLFLGNAGFFYLMFSQFRDHDYYLLPLMPVFFFLLLTAGDLYLRNEHRFRFPEYIRYVVFLAVGLLLIPALNHSKSNQTWRYEGVGYDQFGTNYQPYTNLEAKLDENGFTRDQYVVSIVDNSFNITLYLMNRKGFTFWSGYPQSEVVYRMYRKGDFMVINDSKNINYPSIRHFMDEPAFTHEHLSIYSLNFTEEDRENFLDTMLQTLNPSLAFYQEGENYGRYTPRYIEHFQMTPKEAEVKVAFDTYKWVMSGIIRPVLHEHFPDEVAAYADFYEMAEFYTENRREVEALYAKDLLSERHLILLECPLPGLLYSYTP